MAADLSVSIFQSLQRGLKRARQLGTEGDNAAACDAYVHCAKLAKRYSQFALSPEEQGTRIGQSQQYQRLAEEYRRTPAGVVVGARAAVADRPRPELDESNDEYRAAAEGLIDKTTVTWDQIGGLQEVKDRLRLAYGLALAARPKGMKLEADRSILLYGPPGTGKTLLASAASNELEATFFNVKTSSVLSKYFGESSKLLEAVYQVAREHAPSVIFFDEFDALSGSRDSSDSSGPERRMVATLLAELDGLAGGGAGQAFILTVAATNLPWTMDAAILSRFARRVYVPLPDAVARKSILEVHLTRRGHRLEGSLDELVDRTEGMSGRRMAQACDGAIQRVVMQMNPGLLAKVDQGRKAVAAYELAMRPLRCDDFQQVMKGRSCEVSAEQEARYRQWQEQQ